MIKKILVLGISAILLGGCTLTDAFKTGTASVDSKPNLATSPTPSSTPMASVDGELKAMPSTNSQTDDQSLEVDINNTKILNEDFSDLK